MEDKQSNVVEEILPVANEAKASLVTVPTNGNSWIMVSDGGNQIVKNESTPEGRIEGLPKDPEDGDEARNEHEDFSDSVSIISDGESTGRASPHLFIGQQSIVRETAMEPTTSECELRQRCSGCVTRIQSDEMALLQADEIAIASSDVPATYLPALKRGFIGLFVVGVLVAILAFFSNFQNTARKPLAMVQLVEQLHNRITDLELQNNVIRSQMDILARQVHHLTDLHANQQRFGTSSSSHANGGRGGSLSSLDHSDDDGENSSFAELTKRSTQGRNQFGNVVEDINKVSENIYEEAEKMKRESRAERAARSDNNRIPQSTSQEQLHKSQRQKNEHDDYFKERRDKKTESAHRGNQRQDSREQKSKKRQNKHNSKERFKKYDSKERHAEKYRRPSAYKKQAGAEATDGRWYEQLMQHRENNRNSRKDERRDSNWYVDRGEGRESMRLNDRASA